MTQTLGCLDFEVLLIGIYLEFETLGFGSLLDFT
jgi:hypothetical protein